MKIKISAKDFKDSDFMSNNNCALAKAIKRKLPGVEVREGVRFTSINGKTYLHEPYTSERFNEDSRKAKKYCYLSMVNIRELELEEYDEGKVDRDLQEIGDND